MTLHWIPLRAYSRAFGVLICVALFAPLHAVASGAPDGIERWNIAMTDFSAGLPPPGLPPFVEARVYAMAHIAMLDAVRVASRRGNAGIVNVDAAIAAAAHDVLDAEFGKFIGPNTPFDAAYAQSCRPLRTALRKIGVSQSAEPPLRQCWPAVPAKM